MTPDQWRAAAAANPGMAITDQWAGGAMSRAHPVDGRSDRSGTDRDDYRAGYRAGHASVPPPSGGGGTGGGRKGCPLLALVLLLSLPVLLPALAIHLLLRRTHPTHQTAPGGAPTPTPGPR